MEKRRPAYRHIERKFDISSLIPGDRIHVMLNPDKGPEIMVYAGQTTSEFDSSIRCSFIKIPEGYYGEERDIFYVWESNLRHLQFDEIVRFNSLYMDLKVIQLGTGEYYSTKSLLDAVIS